MFSRLPESNAKRQRRAGGLVVSAAVHLVLIALAVRATTLSATPKPKVDPVTVVFQQPPREAPPPAPTPAPQVTPDAGASVSAPPAVIPPPIDISIVPPTIPEPGSMSSLIDGEEFRRTASRLGDPTAPAGPPNVAGRGPLEERYVDKPIVALPGSATPRYPASLQSAGVEGEVRARFVVDTLGRVEKGSVEILDATHDLFAAAVRDALTRARFRPAEAGGHKVRQLAEQTFTFRITGGI